MNLPISKPVVENVFMDIIEPDKLLLDLNSKLFTGFMYLVTHTKKSFEENFILFLKGNVVGSIYISNNYNLEIYGEKAFELSINSLGYKDGLLNIYELSIEQLKLVLIFNEKIKYEKNITNKNISKLKFKYNENLLDEFIKDKIPEEIEAKYELFDKFNINDLLRY